MTDVKIWQSVHASLTALAARKAGLEYEELVLLLAADRTRAWYHMGNACMREYADRMLGIDGHTLAEKIRTAGKLEVRPLLAAALQSGRLSYSAVRELTRVATPETEQEWIDHATGKTVRQIEARVRACSEGDRPSDPARPDVVKRRLVLELDPETFARVVAALDQERFVLGEGAAQEDALLSFIEKANVPADAGRAPAQVAYTVCESCQRAWVDAPRERIEIAAEAGERACCDANVIPTAARPAARAAQTVTPALRRQIVQRAGGRCEMPGCRLLWWKEIHHVVLQSEGGTHELGNLVLLCGRHHDLVHRGLLTVGLKDGAVVAKHADGTRYGDAPAPAAIDIAKDVFQGLRDIGFREGEIRPVLEDIRAELGALPEKELLKEALKRIGQASRKYVLGPSGAGHAGEAVAIYGRPMWDAGGRDRQTTLAA